MFLFNFENWFRYAVSFFSSVLWISVLCLVMVEAASDVGCKLGINPIVMGVVVLAVGTSVPDAIGSIIAAQSGEAGMAIANAIGSNVFDILLGLGLPWVITSASSSEGYVPISAPWFPDIFLLVVLLLCAVLMFVGCLVANKWKMNKQLGFRLFAFYGLYVIYILADEFFG
jgi:Ca2+/Na+ antiporter